MICQIKKTLMDESYPTEDSQWGRKRIRLEGATDGLPGTELIPDLSKELSSLFPDWGGVLLPEQFNDSLLPHKEEETICFGMLCGINTQLKWYPHSYQQQTMNDGYIPMALDLQNEFGYLQTIDGYAVGVLGQHIFRGLSGMPNQTDVQLKPLVSAVEWSEKTQELLTLGPKSKTAIRMNIDLVLFGQRGTGDIIAKHLAGFQLYLQEPHAGSFQCPYENPQSWIIPGHIDSGELEHDETYSKTLASLGCNELEEDSTVETADLPPLTFDIDSLLDDLPGHDYLSQASTDSRVLTRLLSHQMEAVDFISRRESGLCPPDHSLWDLNISEDGNTYYQHRITGAKSRFPEDCSGGILADDAGLGKSLSILTAIIHSLHTASSFAANTSRESVKSTLIIVPSELLLNTWVREIDRHVLPGTIRFIRYHGTERRELDTSLPTYHIVLTTYGTAMVEYRRRSSILYQLKWYRVVLDEAHTIRNSSSKQFQAVNHISSHHRWCLTGTPIQNSLDDLSSLVRFLKIPILENASIFRSYISSARQESRSMKEELRNLKLLLGSICLRRNRAILPSLGYTTEEVRPEFSPREQEQYRSLELGCKRMITVAMKGNGNTTGHTKVMEALLRLRMFCNNGPLDGTSESGTLGSDSRPDEVLSFFQQSGEAICSYCSCDIASVSSLPDSDTPYLTPCLRLVCHECLVEYQSEYQTSGSSKCPLCNNQHRIHGLEPESTQPVATPELEYPSKIKAVVHDVDAHYLGHKCVIFSFWKRTLDIVAKALENQGLKYLRVDGDVTPRKRSSILADFQSRSSSRILLMTFSTGAVGLNGLTVADRIHILEPQWNPAVEAQAIGRVLRIDQSSRVTVIRYAVQRSIEEVVRSKQLRKLQLAVGGFAKECDHREGRLQQMQQLADAL